MLESFNRLRTEIITMGKMSPRLLRRRHCYAVPLSLLNDGASPYWNWIFSLEFVQKNIFGLFHKYSLILLHFNNLSFKILIKSLNFTKRKKNQNDETDKKKGWKTKCTKNIANG